MNKPNLKLIFNNAKREFIKQSPSILLGIGITGMITSTVMAVKATPKALKLIEKEKIAKRHPEIVYYDNNPVTFSIDPELTKLEVVKIAWKPYIPAITVGALSTLCIVGSYSLGARRTATLAAAYKLSEKALSEYKDAVVQTIGEKKEKEVREKVADNTIDANPINKSTIYVTDKGNTLCYEPLSGRYFKSSPETINKAINEVNYRLINNEYVSLNDFYDLINLESTRLGDSIGWNVFREGKLEIEFLATLTEDKEPCLVLDFRNEPKYDYYKLEY